MTYILISLVVMIIVLSATLFAHFLFGTLTLAMAILGPLGALIYVLVLLGIFALLIRALPSSLFDSDKKIYHVKEKEMKFYNKIKIKDWKDKVPEMGKTAGFSKKNLKSTDIKYIKKFLTETCYAEILHTSSAIVGFTCLFFFSPRFYWFVLPILIVNFVLNMISSIIQRYNRYRLNIVYKFQLRKEKTNEVA